MKQWMIWAAALLTTLNGLAADYTGNNVLAILGANVNTPQFREFKTYWVLNKAYESNYSGIKLYVNDVTGKVEGILIAGEGLTMNNEHFDKYTAKLPFGLSLNDDTSALSARLGHGEKLIGLNTLRFFQKSLAVEVSYNNLRSGPIRSIKIYKSDVARVIASPASKSLMASADNRPAPGNSKTTATRSGYSEAKISTSVSAFKRSIMEIFRAFRESAFASVKADERTSPNFWNYKYAYNTRLSVPGQKYNMVYHFPFLYSPPDFVVVIKEADQYDASFETAYHQFEKELNENFKPSEGWTSSCVPGSNNSKLPNLEIRNDQIGSIILDCSQNPRGRKVLYMRFLFFSS